MKSFSQFIQEQTSYKNGVYIALNVESKSVQQLTKWYNESVKPVTDKPINKDLHCTLIYSKKPHNGDIKLSDSKTYGVNAVSFDQFGSYLVLKLNGVQLKRLHNQLMKQYDFVFDYDEYTPHITLCEFLGDISGLKAPEFTIELKEVVIEDLDESV
jgi:2'-5' RNA ligase